MNDDNSNHDDSDLRSVRDARTNDRSALAPAPHSISNGLGLSDASSLAANVPYHIAQLIAAAAASGSFDPNRQQGLGGGMYGDGQQQGMNQSVAAASSLGASLAQLLGGNPYLASQLALPNLLSLGALGLNPSGNGAGLQMQGNNTPGFGAPGVSHSQAGGAGLHPLYNTPLFASLLQNQQQAQQLLNSSGGAQGQNQNQFASLFPGLTQHNQNQLSSSENRDNSSGSGVQLPLSMAESTSRGGALKVDWPAPHSASYRPSSSADALIPSASTTSHRDRDQRSRSPEPVDPSSSSNQPLNQNSTFIDFLNAISSSGSNTSQSLHLPHQQQLQSGAGLVPSQSQNQNQNQDQNLGAFGNYGFPGLGGAGMNSSGNNTGFPNLSLLGNLGLGMGLPSMNMNGFPSASGSLGMSMSMPNGGGTSSSMSHEQSGQSLSQQGAIPPTSTSRKRSREFDDDLHQAELDFPLPPSMDQLPQARGLERYMTDSDEAVGGSGGGSGSGSGAKRGAGMDVDDGDSNSGRGDALHLDMGRAAYEEDVSGIRASKRGRAG